MPHLCGCPCYDTILSPQPSLGVVLSDMRAKLQTYAHCYTTNMWILLHDYRHIHTTTYLQTHGHNYMNRDIHTATYLYKHMETDCINTHTHTHCYVSAKTRTQPHEYRQTHAYCYKQTNVGTLHDYWRIHITTYLQKHGTSIKIQTHTHCYISTGRCILVPFIWPTSANTTVHMYRHTCICIYLVSAD